jgi:serine/threonine-protein kinase
VDAHLGRADEAIREGMRAVELLPPGRDAYFGVNNVTDLARDYALLGRAAPAIAQLRTIWGMPGAPTVALLRVDPDWDPIRNDPAFQQFLAGAH